MELEIKDLYVSIGGKDIVKGLSLTLTQGEVIALMGPNGSGKSTLASAIMGDPHCDVQSGKILVNGEDITGLSPDKRAQKGIFLSFQYPKEITGVTLANFLRTSYNSLRENPLGVMDFQKLLKEKMHDLQMDSQFTKRYLNEGFSGGEKKRTEILQMMVLEPKFAILDETDSGLDVDALRIVARGINAMKGPHRGILIITHYHRILDYISPDKVFIMKDGKIVKSGGYDMAIEIEKKGYQ